MLGSWSNGAFLPATPKQLRARIVADVQGYKGRMLLRAKLLAGIWCEYRGPFKSPKRSSVRGIQWQVQRDCEVYEANMRRKNKG